MTQVVRISGEFGLDVNVKKTKVMVFSPKKSVPTCRITLGNYVLEQVQRYTYLGQIVTQDGYMDEEIKRRIGMAKSTFMDMRDLFVSGKLGMNTKRRLLQTYIWSVLLYGCETWKLDTQTTKKLESFEMWTFRRIGKISWTKKWTNEKVLEKLNVKRNLLNIIRVRKLQYLGHIKRHPSIMKDTLEGFVQGTRSRGRPRFTWMTNCYDWTGMSLSNINSASQDRQKWRLIAANHQTGDGTT